MNNDASSKPSPEPGGTAADSGFFPWLRGLGVTRIDGWLGGVAAGLAARLGIDPLIVRGIIVVVAVLGGPALLLYAAAWALLPDATGRIHLQELFRGVFDRAIAGVGLLVLIALLPFAGGWWWFGGWWDGGLNGGWEVGSLIWTAIVIGAAIWLVVWIANRSSGQGPEAPNVFVVPPREDTAADAAPASGEHAAPTSAFTEPLAPPAPPEGAADADLAAWREGQSAWKREHDAWRAQQAASEREAHQQRAAQERQRRQAEAAERARLAHEKEQRTRPGAGYTLVAIGIALIAAALTALTVAETDTSFGTQAAASLTAALAVLALAIVVNGLRGRRSGGSGGVAILVIVALLSTGLLGWARGPVITNRDLAWSPSVSDDSELRTVISGDVTLDLEEYFDRESSRIGTVDLFVVSGDVDVIMPADADGRVEVDVVSGTIRVDDEVVDSGAFASAVATYDASGGENRRMLVDIYVIAGDITVTQAD